MRVIICRPGEKAEVVEIDGRRKKSKDRAAARAVKQSKAN